MDRSTLLRYLAIGGAMALFVLFGLPKLTGSDGPRFQPLGKEGTAQPAQRAPEAVCTIEGDRFRAELSTQGATLRHLWLSGAKYTTDGRPKSPPMDLVPPMPGLDRPLDAQIEPRRPLRTEFRRPGADTQVDYDLFDWQLASQTGKECVFTYDDAKVALRKVMRSQGKPFELETEVVVRNKGDKPAVHALSLETSVWRFEKELEGGFGRQSPFTTQLECSNGGKLDDKGPGDFAPKDFSKPGYKDGWYTVSGAIDFASVSNFFFAQALVPLASGSGDPASLTLQPACELQVEDRWRSDRYASKKDDKDAGGSMYRARLAFPPKELGPGESVTYKALHFAGPKEREVLAVAGSGTHRLSELIRLGTFAVIAKVLVAFLIKCHAVVGSWGLAIILLTLTVRTVLFPLTWKTIKSGAKMRQIKPEIDALNAKYADDAVAKQQATMELWKKHGVNPVAGCLPTMLQMPVWFALYTALQTAAELYHTPFLWFRDLSAPDTFHFMHWDLPFILPVLLGATTFIQQKIMPAQMDAQQQKMMTYMMPAIFTAMMLFLPAGLGVYMFTNSLLGIAQQLAVERYYASQQGGGGGSGIGVRDKPGDGGGGGDKTSKRTDGAKKGSVPLALGKGNARV